MSTLNGFYPGVLIEDAGQKSENVEGYVRSESTSLEGTTYGYKRVWDLRLAPVGTEQEIEALRGWVQGRFWSWSFERVDGATTRFNPYEAGGGRRLSPTTGTLTAAASIKFGTWSAQVSSAGVSAITLPFFSGVSPRYSWAVWKLEATSGSVTFCSNVCDGSTSRFFTESTSDPTTAFAWATVGTASGVFSVALEGQNQSGTNAVADYDALFIAPYALSTVQLAALGSRTTQIPAPPFLEWDGLLNESTDPVVVKGYVESESIEQVVLGGSNRTARFMTITLQER